MRRTGCAMSNVESSMKTAKRAREAIKKSRRKNDKAFNSSVLSFVCLSIKMRAQFE